MRIDLVTLDTCTCNVVQNPDPTNPLSEAMAPSEESGPIDARHGSIQQLTGSVSLLETELKSLLWATAWLGSACVARILLQKTAQRRSKT